MSLNLCLHVCMFEEGEEMEEREGRSSSHHNCLEMPPNVTFCTEVSNATVVRSGGGQEVAWTTGPTYVNQSMSIFLVVLSNHMSRLIQSSSGPSCPLTFHHG